MANIINWTPELNNILIKYYGVNDNKIRDYFREYEKNHKDIWKKIDRQAEKLGLKENKWNDKEDEILRKYYNNDRDMVYDILGNKRTVSDINNRARAIGICY